MPVLSRKISDSQAAWLEVKAVEGAVYLIWARPAGTRYLVSDGKHGAVYNDALALAA